jgi:hypothetical protein
LNGRRQCAAHQPPAELFVARGDRVPDRLGGVAAIGVPKRGPPVQDRRAIRRRPG